MPSSTPKWIFASAVALTLVAVVPARAQIAPMPLGARTLPPAGFVDFCRRQPAECQGEPVAATPAPQAAPLLTAATVALPPSVRARPAARPRGDWRLAPASTSAVARVEAAAPVPAPAATRLASPKTEPVAQSPVQPPADAVLDARLQAKAALTQAMQVKRFNAKSLNPGHWSRLTGDPRLDPRLAPHMAPTPPPAPTHAPLPAPQVQPVAPRAATPVSLELLTRVNRQQNRRIARAVDAQAFGREDVWSLPTDDRPQGDCEDYVLAKRQALIAAGVSPDALSIAVVRTRRGEGHAVLLARTAQGEYVLDNLSPWVVAWNEAPYTWVSRQTGGPDRPWVQVGGPSPAARTGAHVIHITLAAG